jgi:hypothetical protein
MARRRLTTHVRPDDIRRLEMLSFAHGGASWSSVVRTALRLLSVQLGLEKNEFPDDFSKS